MAKETKIKKTSIFQQTEFTLGLIIVILFVGASLFTDNFCTLYNVTNLMKQCAIIGVMAAAQTMIIITGGIDTVVVQSQDFLVWSRITAERYTHEHVDYVTYCSYYCNCSWFPERNYHL